MKFPESIINEFQKDNPNLDVFRKKTRLKFIMVRLHFKSNTKMGKGRLMMVREHIRRKNLFEAAMVHVLHKYTKIN